MVRLKTWYTCEGSTPENVVRLKVANYCSLSSICLKTQFFHCYLCKLIEITSSIGGTMVIQHKVLLRRLFLQLRLKLRRLVQFCTSGLRSLYSLMALYKKLLRYLFATAWGRFGMCFLRVEYQCVFVILYILWSSFMHFAKFLGRRLLHNLKPNLHCSSLISCSKGSIRCF